MLVWLMLLTAFARMLFKDRKLITGKELLVSWALGGPVFGGLSDRIGRRKPLYLAGAMLLGGRFLYLAVRMQSDHSDHLAMKTFGYSIFYLMALFAFLLVDHYMPLILG